ncbi:polysaccharide deacetylase family protein [Sporosarcina ureilytica]|uniref:NodB homology domain-containing protein n=1 Tax=Sporosarcina ureilytica TaxID=298596 RepID=A0A1D8JHF1_9BACL|nr:polysaccharide deacetylase family protein [Sporosarcina ureilytica]AOV08145.1 hypothetical protein BI350_11745 [Sporosarcina ureilytica]
MKKPFLFVSIIYIAVIVLVLEVITANPNEQTASIQTSANLIPTNFENENLLEQIHAYANENNREPIDAKVDTVWKAIPGYNGLEVDIEESYLAMWPNETFDEKLIVYKEVSPKVHLADLSPSPIYKGNPEKPMVTLLINVAWGNEFIPDILDTLQQHHVRAAFFFDGSWVKNNPDLAKAIYDKGHEIGNHAYSHPDLKFYSRSQTMNELKKTNDIIEETLSIKPQWFAPPSGSFNDETVTIARELDMFTILWTVDTIDWKKPETSRMVKRVVSEVHNGAMILMHPTKPVAEGLGQMIQEIKDKGYVLGTVSEMLDEKRIEQ